MKGDARELEERLMDSSSSCAAARSEGLLVAPEGEDAQQQQQQQEQQQQQLQLQRSVSRGEAFFLRALMVVKICFFAAVALVLLLALSHIDTTATIVKDLIAGVQGFGYFAPFAYIALYVVFIAFFMPAEFMHLAAGFIFSRIYGETLGIVVAFFCSLCGALLSGLCCFMISRHLLFDLLHSWMSSSTLFRAFDSAVEEGGITFVALIRLSPILPYSLTSYLFGVTALKTSHLLLGTFSGTPLILAFNFIGSALSDLKDLDVRTFSWTWQRLSLIAIGVLMAAASMAYITVLTRRKLEAAYASALQERNQRSQLLLASSPAGLA
ncbi:hypothetical protein, conserved [Eimeria tenella]|uniref:VTT domain-containing protein n=1 Tax=Eimeria tenella TaxID=5802 RepID=U6KQF3_EIMTE|nr:hypothetical protein, conserved [Eimeria tenella]CDJ37668.1 hypothetical protein, conserved [Eimeria tenella]|eukprot:XP_013228506.1 hypothetical protein, conserved [Eimeria tenella]